MLYTRDLDISHTWDDGTTRISHQLERVASVVRPLESSVGSAHFPFPKSARHCKWQGGLMAWSHYSSPRSTSRPARAARHEQPPPGPLLNVTPCSRLSPTVKNYRGRVKRQRCENAGEPACLKGSSECWHKKSVRDEKRSWPIKQVFARRGPAEEPCQLSGAPESYLLTLLTEPPTNWPGNYVIVGSRLRGNARVRHVFN